MPPSGPPPACAAATRNASITRSPIQLHRGELDGLAVVLQALKPIYRSDEAFKADVREKAVKPAIAETPRWCATSSRHSKKKPAAPTWLP